MKVEHTSPKKEVFPKVHILALTNEHGVKIGEAELMYFGRPFRFYYLFFIGVPPEHRGKGFGSFLINSLNAFLNERKSAGLLRNIISTQNPTHSIYHKNGWESVSNFPNWLVFNAKYLNNPQYDRAIHRVKSLETDGKFYHQ